MRITNKSMIKVFNNAQGENKVFNFDLIDESGEIRCAAFGVFVEKFYDLIKVLKFFIIM